MSPQIMDPPIGIRALRFAGGPIIARAIRARRVRTGGSDSPVEVAA